MSLCVASQRVFIVVVYFIIDSVRKLLDTSSYIYIYIYIYMCVCVCVCVYVCMCIYTHTHKHISNID
jgi:hypothetical protein